MVVAGSTSYYHDGSSWYYKLLPKRRCENESIRARH
jgi:hypothetical protein